MTIKVKKYVTETVEVDVDLVVDVEVSPEDFEDKDLIKEVEERGYFVVDFFTEEDLKLLREILIERQTHTNWEERRLLNTITEALYG